MISFTQRSKLVQSPWATQEVWTWSPKFGGFLLLEHYNTIKKYVKPRNVDKQWTILVFKSDPQQ